MLFTGEQVSIICHKAELNGTLYLLIYELTGNCNVVLIWTEGIWNGGDLKHGIDYALDSQKKYSLWDLWKQAHLSSVQIFPKEL